MHGIPIILSVVTKRKHRTEEALSEYGSDYWEGLAAQLEDQQTRDALHEAQIAKKKLIQTIEQKDQAIIKLGSSLAELEEDSLQQASKKVAQVTKLKSRCRGVFFSFSWRGFRG